MTYLLNQIKTFSSGLHRMSLESRVIEEKEQVLFEQLIKLVGELHLFIEEQTEERWLNYFLTHPMESVSIFLNEFIQSFNYLVAELNLSDKPPCVWNPSTEKSEIVHDLGIIQQLLENLNNSEIVSHVEELKTLRDALSKEAGIDNESKRPKALEMSAIAESLSSLGQWEIDTEDLELTKKIASGGFGEVFLGYRKSDGTVVAVKRLHNQRFDEKMLEMFKSEVATLAKLKHFSILPFVGACTKPPFCIVTQFMSGGSLFSRLHAKDESDRLSPTQLSIIALGIAYGMAYLHDQQMIHRDLKSLNILLDADSFPKICDFGMASTKGSGTESLSSGIGTSQWMAPEVLTHQHYDEKSDVYSFGIILWEMLTGDVPYRGLRDIQVAMTVINQNNRPKIPTNCPQNLSSLIRACWSSDVSRRPTFHSIIRAVESGAVSFPGTDISKLKSYSQLFSSPATNNDDQIFSNRIEIDPHSITEGHLGKMIEDLRSNNDLSVQTLITAVQRPEILALLSKFNIMSVVTDRIGACTDIGAISNYIVLLSYLITDESMLASFLEHNGSKILLDILLKFSTSTMPKLVDCLSLVIKREKGIITPQHMSKIAPFLLCNDLTVRRNTIELLESIIQRGWYEDDSAFSLVVENLLRNAVPEARSDVLLDTLLLLNKITAFEAAKAQFRCVEGPDRICSLMMHENPSILAAALRLLQMLFEGIQPKQRTVSVFLEKFAYVLSKADYDGQLEALNALTMLMDNSLVYKEVSACDTFCNAFLHCINSPDNIVQVSALRICFAFCNNPITEGVFLPLLPSLFQLLQSSTYPAIISAFSIAALLAVHDPLDVLGEYQETIRNFIKRSLAIESELTAPALRLVGILASSMNGSSLLDQWCVMPDVAILMKSSNLDLNRLAVMAMTAMSAASPDCEVMFQSIPMLFEACKDSSFGYYPIVCLSNITVDPKNAVACVPFLQDLFYMIKETEIDRLSKQRAIITLHRVIMTPEASDSINSIEIINDFLSCADDLWSSEHAPILFAIIESLTAIEKPREALKAYGMGSIIEEKIKYCQLSDPTRPKLIRIKARLSK